MRECGILLPIASLPSNYGIGAFSKEAYEFVDQLKAAKAVHFVMQEVITPKFLELNPERPEQQEASAFDEYDEEEGYNEEAETESVWRVLRENVDRVVKLCIRSFHDSYSKCMESDIMSLLDYVKFEIMTAGEN